MPSTGTGCTGSPESAIPARDAGNPASGYPSDEVTMAAGCVDLERDPDEKDIVMSENDSSTLPSSSSTSPEPDEYERVESRGTVAFVESLSVLVPLPDIDSTVTESPDVFTVNPLGPDVPDVTISEILRVMEEPEARADTGLGSMSFTVMGTTSKSVPPLPSETTTVTECSPSCDWSGVHENEPPRVMEAPRGTSPASEYAKESPSESVAVAINSSVSVSSTLWDPMAPSTGAEFSPLPEAVTVTGTSSESVELAPSATVTLMVCSPICASAGVQVKVPESVMEAPDGNPAPSENVRESGMPLMKSPSIAVAANDSVPTSAVTL